MSDFFMCDSKDDPSPEEVRRGTEARLAEAIRLTKSEQDWNVVWSELAAMNKSLATKPSHSTATAAAIAPPAPPPAVVSASSSVDNKGDTLIYMDEVNKWITSKCNSILPGEGLSRMEVVLMSSKAVSAIESAKWVILKLCEEVAKLKKQSSS